MTGLGPTVHLASTGRDAADLSALADLVAGGDVAVLSGADLSTDSPTHSGTTRNGRSARGLGLS